MFLLFDGLGWVGWVSRLVGWVEEIGLTDNSGRLVTNDSYMLSDYNGAYCSYITL